LSQLILYNYRISPFSEKIRAMLGYAQLSWQSVTVMPMPPRPTLDILAGGYRKIPVAQIGADVFCDSKMIARQVARLGNKPELILENCSPEAQAFSRRVDLDIFFASLSLLGPGVILTLKRETSWMGALAFIKDRAGLLGKATFKPAAGKKAKAMFMAHLAEMETMLEQDFLFGDAPCAADFSAYHSLWMVMEVGGKNVVSDVPAVQAWYARMRAFGHGGVTSISAEQALDIARDATPAEMDADAGAAQKQVSIAPADYARDPVTGILVAEQAFGWVLQREHPRVGHVHVHLPKAGYALH
tara:strand:- start:605 stop:1504 length:900 start_codon:yes stop_codon:yes gene_type:complete